jgi:hypothetical protein
MLLGLTMMHDADTTAPHSLVLATQQKHAALQHWNIATKLFNLLLTKPIIPAYRDAVWATGMLIGAASFWYMNSHDPAEVWPLKPSEPDDLAWLKLGEGKKFLWRIADPSRPDSVFYELMQNKNRPCHSAVEWIEMYDTAMQLPQRVKQIFNLTPTSTIENNVYHLPLLILSRIQNVHLTHDNVVSFLYVTAFVTPELLHLLEIKDPRAVFIIGWWFDLIADGDLWWMTSRAKVERHAIRIWLWREDKIFGLARLLDDLALDPGAQVDFDVEAPASSIWAHAWKMDNNSIRV